MREHTIKTQADLESVPRGGYVLRRVVRSFPSDGSGGSGRPVAVGAVRFDDGRGGNGELDSPGDRVAWFHYRVIATIFGWSGWLWAVVAALTEARG